MRSDGASMCGSRAITCHTLTQARAARKARKLNPQLARDLVGLPGAPRPFPVALIIEGNILGVGAAHISAPLLACSRYCEQLAVQAAVAVTHTEGVSEILPRHTDGGKEGFLLLPRWRCCRGLLETRPGGGGMHLKLPQSLIKLP